MPVGGEWETRQFGMLALCSAISKRKTSNWRILGEKND